MQIGGGPIWAGADTFSAHRPRRRVNIHDRSWAVDHSEKKMWPGRIRRGFDIGYSQRPGRIWGAVAGPLHVVRSCDFKRGPHSVSQGTAKAGQRRRNGARCACHPRPILFRRANLQVPWIDGPCCLNNHMRWTPTDVSCGLQASMGRSSRREVTASEVLDYFTLLSHPFCLLDPGSWQSRRSREVVTALGRKTWISLRVCCGEQTYLSLSHDAPTRAVGQEEDGSERRPERKLTSWEPTPCYIHDTLNPRLR